MFRRKSFLSRLMGRGLRALIYGAIGAAVAFLIVFIVYLNGRTDLDIWHQANLDEEFTAASPVADFTQYQALEERLFKQLDNEVYAKVAEAQQTAINRYSHNGLSDPKRWETNWNRSFVLSAEQHKAGVLLLHGMSDGPYSLRHIGERLNASGAVVLGLRLPGHGTAPSGLLTITWQDMAAAVRLAMRELAALSDDKPLYIVGYSNGAALAVNYALASIEDPALPPAARIVVVSPAIGVAPVTALAVWQSRLGRLLGLEKLQWNSILSEYDPFKYGSFAVNAGNVVYLLTREIQARITALQTTGKLVAFPPLIAFSSVADATVSVPSLVEGLFNRLPSGERELVLFDVNRMAEIAPILKWDPSSVVEPLKKNTDRKYALSVVGNESADSRRVVVRRLPQGTGTETQADLDASWPRDVYSLAHVALPFPETDTLYGRAPQDASPVVHLGNMALRGERGILKISASELLRMRWNPFYSFVENRAVEFLGLGVPETGNLRDVEGELRYPLRRRMINIAPLVTSGE